MRRGLVVGWIEEGGSGDGRLNMRGHGVGVDYDGRGVLDVRWLGDRKMGWIDGLD